MARDYLPEHDFTAVLTVINGPLAGRVDCLEYTCGYERKERLGKKRLDYSRQTRHWRRNHAWLTTAPGAHAAGLRLVFVAVRDEAGIAYEIHLANRQGPGYYRIDRSARDFLGIYYVGQSPSRDGCAPLWKLDPVKGGFQLLSADGKAVSVVHQVDRWSFNSTQGQYLGLFDRASAVTLRLDDVQAAGVPLQSEPDTQPDEVSAPMAPALTQPPAASPAVPGRCFSATLSPLPFSFGTGLQVMSIGSLRIVEQAEVLQRFWFIARQGSDAYEIYTQMGDDLRALAIKNGGVVTAKIGERPVAQWQIDWAFDYQDGTDNQYHLLLSCAEHGYLYATDRDWIGVSSTEALPLQLDNIAKGGLQLPVV
ncbi:hypothetical protein [Pseudomonas sp. KNUC1026]|uniref:hypothetical protein n=1 Tax=Pseudomonas sp. KNUC1026 TaxID=2893890 RepID=UPI001F455147|nr:hypothetical protein [Pseudomonas sp. KNUC1026]UFH51067.1 hypothetical protein LN139_08485 [Pseudomonas sp. KNUC1026]